MSALYTFANSKDLLKTEPYMFVKAVNYSSPSYNLNEFKQRYKTCDRKAHATKRDHLKLCWKSTNNRKKTYLGDYGG